MDSFDKYKKEISQSLDTFTTLANKNKGILIYYLQIFIIKFNI